MKRIYKNICLDTSPFYGSWGGGQWVVFEEKNGVFEAHSKHMKLTFRKIWWRIYRVETQQDFQWERFF